MRNWHRVWPGAVAIVVVLGLVVVLWPGGRGNGSSEQSPDTSAPSTAPVSRPTTSPVSAVPNPGRVADESETCPTSKGKPMAVGKVQWEAVGTTRVPASNKGGPLRDFGGVEACFSHDEFGAVLMATWSAVQATGSDADEWADYALRGPVRDELLSGGFADSSSTGLRLTVAGYRVLEMTDDKARVEVGLAASGNGDSVNILMAYELRWVDGDWRVWVTDATTPVDVAVVPSLSGLSGFSA